MSTSQRNRCFDPLILERLLNEQLQGAEEAAVLSHIETCTSCRALMEQMTGLPDLSDEIHQHLANHDVKDPGAATLLESPGRHADLLQIQGLLGPTDDPQMLGRLGAYEIVGIVGRGSTGVVFKSLDRRLNRYVAIKMLLPAYSGNGPARRRFEREGRSIASVRDEHVIPVFAVDEHQGLPFIVMEYMPAGSLEQQIEDRGALDTGEVVRVGMQIAQALAAAHKQGIVHRDVKPANVLLASGIERALVTDFGLARILDEASMTHSGAISGTPQFMSPEQARGETVDHRSDLFSLGSVMYAAATGHSPFRSETVFGVIKRVCESTPRPIRETNPTIKGWLCRFIEKLHAKDPADRFQSAAEVSDLLAEELAYLQSPAIVPRPLRLWLQDDRRTAVWKKSVGVVLAGTLCTVAAALWTQGSPQVSAPTNVAGGLPQFELMRSIELVSSADADGSGPAGARPDDFGEGMALHEDGQYAAAIARFRRAIDRGDRVAAARYNIGCALALQGQTEKALDSLEEAHAEGFRDLDHYLTDADLKSVRGHQRMQQLVESMAAERRIARSLTRGTLLRQQQRFAEAELMFRTVLELDEDNHRALQELGLSLHFQGKLQEAIVFHRRAARTQEYARLANYNIGCYHALQGEADNAFAYLQTSIDLGFDDITHLESDPDLDALRHDPRYEQMLQTIERERRIRDWTEHERQCFQLLEAISSNQISRLESLLETVDPNCSCPDYRTPFGGGEDARQSPLTFAARLGRRRAASVLLYQGADVNRIPKGGPTPLMAAAASGHPEMVELLLKAGARVDASVSAVGTALSQAAGGNHVGVMQQLLDVGASVDQFADGAGTPLMCGLEHGSDAALNLLLRRDADVTVRVAGVGTAFTYAARFGRTSWMNRLAECGADINEVTTGVGTPVIAAVRAGQWKTYAWLAGRGADLEISVASVGTALSVAARDDRMRFLQDLVQRGVDVDHSSEGLGTPLNVAVKNGETEAARYLLAQGADPNQWVQGVYPPLAAAVRNDDRPLVSQLLKCGACADLSQPGMMSAVALASEQDNQVLFRQLVDSRVKQ